MGAYNMFTFSVLPFVCPNLRPFRRLEPFIFTPTTPVIFCFGIGDEAHVFWLTSEDPRRRDLAQVPYYQKSAKALEDATKKLRRKRGL